MATDVFDLFARLSLDTSAYEKGLSGARNLATSAGSAIGRGISRMARTATIAMAATTTAITAFTKGAIQTGLSFDAAMGQVAATAGKTEEELAETVGHVNTAYGEFNGTLRDFAKFMGKNTAFTATEAAQALNYMALAGYNTQQSMEMLPIVLDMAAAGSMDLARASDMITDTQSALGLTSERTALMVDEFAKAASTGNTSVEQLGEAFLTVGGLGKELNNGFVQLSDGTMAEIDNIEQLEIAFTAMANAGIKGSEAGTHMRNMLLKLSNPTKQGQEALEAMGISIFDTEGRMKSLDVIFSQLNASFEQMTQQEKLSTIGELFNARDTASAEALLAAVEQDWDRIGESILDAKGSATQMAETKLDNLQGQLTKMKSALEGAKIALSDKLTPSLKDLAAYGTEAISKLTTAFEEKGLEGAVEEAGELLGDVLNKAIEKLPALTGIASTILSTIGQGLLDNIDQVAEAAAQIFEQIATFMVNGSPGLLDAMGTLVLKLMDWLVENADLIIDGIVRLMEKIATYLGEHGSELITGMANLMVTLVQSLPEIIKPLLEALPGVITDIGQALIDAIPQMVKGLTNLISLLCEQLPDIIQAIIDIIPDLLKSIMQAVADNLPTIISGLMDVIVSLANQLPDLIVSIIDALPDLIDKLLTAILDSLPAIIEGLINVVIGIVSHIDEIIVALVKAIPKIISSIISALWKALPQLIKGLIQLVIGIVKNIPQIISGLIEAIPDIIKAILEAFGGLFEGLGEAFAGLFDAAETILGPLVDLFKNIFNGIVEFLGDPIEKIKEFFSGIHEWASEKLQAISDFFSEIWEGFKSFLSEPLEKVKGFFSDVHEWASEKLQAVSDFFSSIWNGFKDFLSDPLEKIKGFFTTIWEWASEKLGWIGDKVSSVFSAMKEFVDWINPFSSSGVTTDKGAFEAVTGMNTDELFRKAGLKDEEEATIKHTGTITLEGVNDEGQFVASAEYVMDDLVKEMQKDARYIPGVG